MEYQAPAIEDRQFVMGSMVTISDGGEPPGRPPHCDDGNGQDFQNGDCIEPN